MGKCLSCFQQDCRNVSSIYVSSSQGSPKIIKQQQHLQTQHNVTPTPIADKSRNSLDTQMFAQHVKYPLIKRGSDKRSLTREYSEFKITKLFESYRDGEDDAILAEGIERFCADLDVKPDDFIVLVLAWKFNAQTMCKFTREEFLTGCKHLRADSIKSIQLCFPDLLNEVQEKTNFHKFHKWAFHFGLDHDSGQRMLGTDIAVLLWRLLFTQNEPPLLDAWLDFLTKNTEVKGITRDTWDMFYNFIDQVTEDFYNYDDKDAWPSLIDDFVEYETDRRNQNV